MCKGQNGSFSILSFSSWGSRNVRNRSSSSFSHTTVSSLMMGGASSTFVWETTFVFLGARGFVGWVRLRGAGTPSDMLKQLNTATRARCVYMTYDHQSTFNMSFFIFNDLSKRPLLPRPRFASNGTTRDPSTSLYVGQTSPHLETERAIDWYRSSRSRWDPTIRWPTCDDNKDTSIPPCDERIVSYKSRGWVDGNNPTNASRTGTRRVHPSRG